MKYYINNEEVTYEDFMAKAEEQIKLHASETVDDMICIDCDPVEIYDKEYFPCDILKALNPEEYNELVEEEIRSCINDIHEAIDEEVNLGFTYDDVFYIGYDEEEE